MNKLLKIVDDAPIKHYYKEPYYDMDKNAKIIGYLKLPTNINEEKIFEKYAPLSFIYCRSEKENFYIAVQLFRYQRILFEEEDMKYNNDDEYDDDNECNDDEEKDDPRISEPWVLFFVGNDDLSLGMRFKTKEEALSFFNEENLNNIKDFSDIFYTYN